MSDLEQDLDFCSIFFQDVLLNSFLKRSETFISFLSLDEALYVSYSHVCGCGCNVVGFFSNKKKINKPSKNKNEDLVSFF